MSVQLITSKIPKHRGAIFLKVRESKTDFVAKIYATKYNSHDWPLAYAIKATAEEVLARREMKGVRL